MGDSFASHASHAASVPSPLFHSTETPVLSFLKRLRPASLLVLAATAACGGGGDGGGGTTPPPPPPTPAIALSLSATATTLQAGGNTSFTATIARTNFTGAVTVTVGGAPTGVTSTVTPSGDTYTIALSTVATAAAGTFPLTITAAGTGVSNATATYTLTLTAPPAASYTLAVTPATLSVQQGQSGNATVNITRTNFTGAVGLAVTGAPAGVTPTLGAASVTGDNTTLAIAVATTVAAGNYTLTVTGTATGQANRTATLTLTVTAAPSTGSIALSVTPNPLSIAQGATGTATLNIARTNFTGSVTLAASGAPAGVTLTLSSVNTTANSVTANFTVAAGTVPGNYTINFEGVGTGIANATTTLTLTITPVAAGSISITAGNNTIQAGASGSINVFVTRTNYTGSVSLVATGMPNGVTTTYTQPGNGNSGQVTFGVGASVAAGNYPITVTASGTGVANATATGTLTVTAPPSGGGNVTMNFCGTDIPIWLAAQNGNGAWTQVAGGANNTYSFNITSTGAVAWVEQEGNDQFTLNLVYGNSTELQQRGTCAGLVPTNRTATGTVAGFGSSLASFVSVSFGNAGPTTAPTAAAPNFTINNIAAGALDLLASRASFNIATSSIAVDKIFIRRGLNPPNGGSLGTIDFNGADAFDPDTRTVAIGGAVAGENLSASTIFSTGSFSTVVLGSSTSTGTAATFVTVPSARTQAGDLHIVAAGATQTSASLPVVAARTVTTMARQPGNLNVTLGQALSTPTVTSTNGAYARMRFSLARQSDYPNLWAAGFEQGNGNTSRNLNVIVFASAAGAGTVTMEVPDFSGVSGWQNIWGPRVGTQGTWSMQANGWISGNGLSAEGTVIRTAQRFGNLTP